MTADVTPLASVPRAAPGQQVALRHAEGGCRLVSWTPRFGNNTLIGHASIVTAAGIIVNLVPVFRGSDGLMSVGVPTAAQLDADGRVRLKDGKRLYSSILTFATAEGRERWQRMVLGALAAGGIGVAP